MLLSPAATLRNLTILAVLGTLAAAAAGTSWHVAGQAPAALGHVSSAVGARP